MVFKEKQNREIVNAVHEDNLIDFLKGINNGWTIVTYYQ